MTWPSNGHLGVYTLTQLFSLRMSGVIAESVKSPKSNTWPSNEHLGVYTLTRLFILTGVNSTESLNQFRELASYDLRVFFFSSSLHLPIVNSQTAIEIELNKWREVGITCNFVLSQLRKSASYVVHIHFSPAA